MKSTFSKIRPDARTFSKDTADFSRVKVPFFGYPRSFHSKIAAYVTADAISIEDTEALFWLDQMIRKRMQDMNVEMIYELLESNE